MKIKWSEKYTTRSVYAVITFSLCLIVYLVLGNISGIFGGLAKFLSVIAPVIWGIVIAYLVNPITKMTAKLSAEIINKKKEHPKAVRIISVVFSMLVFIGLISGFVAIVIPDLIDSITGILSNFNVYSRNLEEYINKILENYPDISQMVNQKLDNVNEGLFGYINEIIPEIKDLAVKVKDGAISFAVALKDFIIGIIVAFYLLFDKEHFLAQLKKVSTALIPEDVRGGFFRVCDRTNLTLSSFISGKIIDSVIIGILTFICMSFMHIDYALLISVIVGFTNIIPVFGPIFGAIPSAFLLLVSHAEDVIPFIVLIIIIQQLDGNVIGPKILGQATGLSAFWVLFAILVGGGLFGFVGMLLGVPIFAVVYSLIEEFINFRLESRGLSTTTDEYLPVFMSGKEPEESKKLGIFGKKTKKTDVTEENEDKEEKVEK